MRDMSSINLISILTLLAISVSIGLAGYICFKKREKEIQAEWLAHKSRLFSAFSKKYMEIADVSIPVEYSANWKTSDIGSLVSNICRSCEPFARENEIRLIFGPHTEPLEIEHIPFYTHIIVEELIRNAIKFSPADSEVLITTRLNDGIAQIYVSDNGVGMTAGQKEIIFEPFYQIDKTEDRGIGIGLPMAKMAVDAMDGHIDVFSFPNMGSTFIVNIPVRKRFSLNLPREREKRMSPSERSFIHKFSTLVEQMMEKGDKINYDKIASDLCMSRPHLNRKLKAITGQTTSECILHIRMSVAKRLLDNTDIPIGDVALRCGMQHFTHFSSLFRKTTGMTPSQYKKRNH